MTLAAEGLDEQILRLLRLEAPPRDLSRWLAMLETLEHPAGEVRIGVVGKYVQLEDAYKSLREALGHGGLANRQRVVIEWIEAEDIDSPATAERLLRHVDGILSSRRIREAWHCGDGSRDYLCARKKNPIFRHLPGDAVRHDRVRSSGFAHRTRR